MCQRAAELEQTNAEIENRIEHVKTGLRGVAVIRLDHESAWPEALEQRIPPEMFE